MELKKSLSTITCTTALLLSTQLFAAQNQPAESPELAFGALSAESTKAITFAAILGAGLVVLNNDSDTASFDPVDPVDPVAPVDTSTSTDSTTTTGTSGTDSTGNTSSTGTTGTR